MKKLLILLGLFFFLVKSGFSYQTIFTNDTACTNPACSIYFAFQASDSLGVSGQPDTIRVIRLRGSAIIDTMTCVGSNCTTVSGIPGLYIFAKKARVKQYSGGTLPDSVGYGTYIFSITWQKNSWKSGATQSYTVRPDSFSRVGMLYVRSGFSLSSQGRADIWTEDTTGINSGFAQITKAISKALIGGNYWERYYRPTPTSAPDSVVNYSGSTPIAVWKFYYNASGKTDSSRVTIY